MKELMNSLYKSDFSLHEYDRYYFGLRYLGNKFLLKKLENLELKGKKILDIGSGRLILSSLISYEGARVVSLDLPDVFKDWKVRKRSKLHKMDLVGFKIGRGKTPYLPFRDHCFWAVLFTEVIEHLNFSPIPLLREIRRVLKDGGYLILTTPNVHCLENKINYLFFNKNIYCDFKRYLNEPPFNIHWREFEKGEIVKVLNDYSFEVVKSYFCNDILINKYSNYLFNGIIEKVKSYAKKWCYMFSTFCLPGFKKQIVVIARKMRSDTF